MECFDWYDAVFCSVGAVVILALFVFALIQGIEWLIRVNKAIGKANRADELSRATDWKVFEGYPTIKSMLNGTEDRVDRLEEEIAKIKDQLPKPRKQKRG